MVLRQFFKVAFSSVKDEAVKLYKPTSALKFTNGLFLVYQHKNTRAWRNSNFLSLGVSLIAFYSGRKLYHHDQRGWFGLLFYTSIFATSMIFLRKFEKKTSQFALEMFLHKDGRNVQITRKKFFIFNDTFHTPIKNIKAKSPEEMIKNFKMEQLYTIKTKVKGYGKIYFLRESSIPDSGVMKAILKGICIDALEEGEVEVF